MDILRGERLAESSGEVSNFISSVADDQVLIEPVRKINIAHMLMLSRRGLVKKSDAVLCIDALSSMPKDLTLDPKLEDVHMNVEAYVVRATGEVAGGQLNLGKSRNDQVATAIRMVTRDLLIGLMEETILLGRTLIEIGRGHTDYVLPAYTHLQHAQPTTLSHYFLAHHDAVSRGIERMIQCYPRVNFSPLGAGAISTVALDLDRDYVAALLGFDGLVENSMDAVSSRDFALEVLSIISMLMVDLQRIANEIVLWSTSEFSYLVASDEFSSTSSIMPQKKNPVVAEMVRSRASLVLGDLMAGMSIAKSLSLGYDLDLQDLTPRLWDAFKNTTSSVSILTMMLKSITFDKDSMRRGLEEESGAADLASYLAVNSEIPFRKAHHIIGSIARSSVENGLPFRRAIQERLGEVSVRMTGKKIEIDAGALDSILDPVKNVESKKVRGGPSSQESKRMLSLRENLLDKYSRSVEEKKEALKQSEEALREAISQLKGGDR